MDCRAAFANLDAVKETLVLGVVRIAMATRATTRGRHTKRTAAFVKACVAFCFITTPSIDTPLLRVRLHLLTACAALANALLPQMDASFKAAVTIVTEMQGLAANESPPLTTTQAEAAAKEEALVSILSSACSLLIAVPGHPDHGPFHMATGLLNIFHSCHWRRPASLPTLHLRMLSVFNAYAQPTLPYRAPGVDANDVLYAAEAGYHESLDAVASKLLETLLGDLAALKERTDGASQRVQARRLPSGVPCPARAAWRAMRARAQASIALQLADLIAATTSLTPPLAGLCCKLLGLALRSDAVDKAHARNVGACVARLAAERPKSHAELWAKAAPLFDAIGR